MCVLYEIQCFSVLTLNTHEKYAQRQHDDTSWSYIYIGKREEFTQEEKEM